MCRVPSFVEDRDKVLMTDWAKEKPESVGASSLGVFCAVGEKCRLVERLQPVDGFGWVGIAEDEAASYEHVGSGFDALRCCCAIDSAVDFDESAKALFADHLAQATDFAKRVVDELLSAEARIDRHEEYHVDLGEYVGKEFDGRVRVECDCRPHAAGAYLLQSAVEMRASLVVYVEQVGAEVAEERDVALWIDDHEVYVERLLGYLLDAFDYGRAERDVGNEDAIHNIDVDEVGFGVVDHFALLSKVTEVGRKDRRRYESVHFRLVWVRV